jgi:hypothetical protein
MRDLWRVGAALVAVVLVRSTSGPAADGMAMAQGSPPYTLDVLGGTVGDLVSDGARLFVTVGPHLYVLSVPAAGAAPERLGELGGFERLLTSLALDDTRLYAALDGGGIARIDIARPEAPRLLEVTLPGLRVTRMVADGGYLYVIGTDGSSSGVEVLDMRRPGQEKVVAVIGQPQLPAAADLLVDGDRLYIAAAEAGLAIYDVSQAVAPRVMAWVEDMTVLRLAMAGDVLAVAELRLSENGTLREDFVTVFRTAADPVITKGGSVKFDGLKELAGGPGVVFGRSGGALRAVDVTDPQAPQPLGPYFQLLPTYALAGRMVLTRDRLFLGRNAVSVWEEGNGETTTWACRDIAVLAIDARDAARLRTDAVWSLPLPGETTVLLADAGQLFLGDRCGVRIYDLGGSGPTYRSTLAAQEFQRPRFLGRQGNLLVVVDEYLGLSLVDIADISRPLVLTEVDLPTRLVDEGGIRSMGVGTDTVTLLTYRGYLLVLDVSAPASPRVAFAGSLLARSGNRALAQRGSTVYAATDFGLTTIDLSNPAQPQLGDSGIGGRALRGLTLAGRYLYGAVGWPNADATWQGLLAVFDIADGGHPRLVGSLDMTLDRVNSLAPFTVAVEGQTAAVVAGERQVHLVDVSDPARPVERSSVPLADIAHGLGTYGEDLYVAVRESGLVIIRDALEQGESGGPAKTVYLPLAVQRRH